MAIDTGFAAASAAATAHPAAANIHAVAATTAILPGFIPTVRVATTGNLNTTRGVEHTAGQVLPVLYRSERA